MYSLHVVRFDSVKCTQWQVIEMMCNDNFKHNGFNTSLHFERGLFTTHHPEIPLTFLHGTKYTSVK